MYIKTLILKFRVIKICLTFFILVIANLINAQERAYVGAKYGYGLSRYYFVSDSRYDDSLVVQGKFPNWEWINQYGVVFNHFNEKKWGFQIEVLMTQKSWKEVIKEGVYRVAKYDYIEVPLLTQYRFGKGKAGLVVNLGIYGAFQYDFKVDSIGEIDWENDRRYVLGDSVVTFIDYQNLGNSVFDYGFKGGLAFDLDIGIFNFQIQAIYNQSVQNVIDPRRDGIYRSLNQGVFVNAIFKVRLYRKDDG